MGRKILITGLVFIFSFTLSSFSEEPLEKKSVIEKQLEILTKKEDNPNPFDPEIPDWLERVSFSFEFESDKHPTFYFETVQPLYQTLDILDTYFIQPRVSLRGGDLTYNLGLGYRKIINPNLLLGVNFFGDYQDLHEHGRAGLGFEALSQLWEARLNGYFGITSKRVVEDSPTSTTYEKIADGLDFELGTPVPYLPWLKVYGSGFWYDFSRFNDKRGWKSRLEAKPTDFLTVDMYVWDDNKGETEYGIKFDTKIPFHGFSLKELCSLFKLAKEPYPEKDLKEYVLIPVERNFDIVVEKWIETAGVSIEVGRQ